jgi:hypothetical protein
MRWPPLGLTFALVARELEARRLARGERCAPRREPEKRRRLSQRWTSKRERAGIECANPHGGQLAELHTLRRTEVGTSAKDRTDGGKGRFRSPRSHCNARARKGVAAGRPYPILSDIGRLTAVRSRGSLVGAPCLSCC